LRDLSDLNMEQPPLKVGQLVRNERQRRWGQVVWDERRWQFESGEPGRILVFDTERRGTIDWPLSDLSVIVSKGKIVWEDVDLAGRLDQAWRETELRA
jgi:hypothetical protein